jgi:hypothetical protein
MRPGRAADHSPPSSDAVMEEYSYTSTHPLGHTGPVTGTFYLLPLNSTPTGQYVLKCNRTNTRSANLIEFILFV